MDIGLGLPITDPAGLPDWGRRAEGAGFATLALLDRLTYDNPEPMVALAVLAGVTTRIRLQTEVLLAPLRSPALLAKQAATLDVMSGGRFTLGLGVGGREDDHAAAGVPITERGRRMDGLLRDVRAYWAGDLIGPRPVTPGGPPILIGGFAEAALRRVAVCDGFICAAPPEWAGGLIRSTVDAWTRAGRHGRPRIVCQVNAAAGPSSTVDNAADAVAQYYAFTGRPGWGAPIADPGRLAEVIAAYRELGADEVILYCYGEDPGQVERLARHL